MALVNTLCWVLKSALGDGAEATDHEDIDAIELDAPASAGHAT